MHKINKSQLNWKKVKIKDIFRLDYGRNLPADKRSGNGFTVYGSNGAVGQHHKPLVNSSGIVVGRKGSIGKVEYSNMPFWPIDTTYYIEESNKYYLKWVYYLLQTLDLEKMNRATGVPGLNREDVYNINVFLPPLTTQQKIAEIFSSLDKAIQKTDQIIQKTEELKQGLMQELLTKGIGHKKFKKTKIGEIPEEWKVSSILDSDIEIIGGDRGVNYPKQHEFYSEGFCLFLSNKNIRNDSFDFGEPVFISQEKDKQIRKGKLNRWDVILTTRGTVGNVAIYDDSITFDHIRINSGMLIFRAGNSISPEFLYYLLKSPLFKERYIQLGSGSAQPQLPIGSLKNLLIPIPHRNEQIEIVKQLKFLDSKHVIELIQKNNLLNLKNGLMQDIFSQKISIN